MHVLIVGIGNMGFAIASALHKNTEKYALHVHDPWSKFLDKAKTVGMRVHDSLDESRHVDYDVILLAVKPDVITQTLQLLELLVKKATPTVISIAAGIEIATVANALCQNGSSYPHVVRYMPTIAALVSKSITAVSAHEHANDKDIQRGLEIAQSFGSVVELPEQLMDAFTGIAGSGIAFATAFIDALTLGGVKEGLPYDKAYRSACKATEGSLALLEQSFSSPSALMTAISSPGGTTIAGLHSLHKHGVYAGVMNAVLAASQRSKELRSIKKCV